MERVRCVGLDVHEATIVIAVADPDGSEPMLFRKIPHELNQLVKELQNLGHSAKLNVGYEAGPTGFGICRKLLKAGIECHVVAPSRIPTQGKQKTDVEDAKRIARFLRSGDLKGIHVPDAETEGLRALTRAREDALGAQQQARGQLRQFLVREGLKWEGKTAWTKAHIQWIRALQFDHSAKSIVRDDYLREVEAVAHRVDRLSLQVETAAGVSKLHPLIQALQALRGVQLITAATIAAEVGDFHRFSQAKHFMSYLGLVPREASSGERQWQGSITKAGNSHLRRVVGEAAWHYRFGGTSSAIQKRRKGLDERTRAIADKAQIRLQERWSRMTARKKESNKICIAVARELAGFIWAIGKNVEMKAVKPNA